ncbi:MAG: hypothetical protein J6T92_07085 [Ottowia sp.]|nr:hypothetical protein [Ottowia sp.]
MGAKSISAKKNLLFLQEFGVNHKRRQPILGDFFQQQHRRASIHPAPRQQTPPPALPIPALLLYQRCHLCMLRIMKKLFVLFCLSISLSACYISDNGRGKCIHGPQSVYCFEKAKTWEEQFGDLFEKEGTTTEQKKQDIKSCGEIATKKYNENKTVSGAFPHFVQCMKEKGYEKLK